MKANEYWALYNSATLWCVEKTRRECVEKAREATGESWRKSKKYFRIIKVTVTRTEKDQ